MSRWHWRSIQPSSLLHLRDGSKNNFRQLATPDICSVLLHIISWSSCLGDLTSLPRLLHSWKIKLEVCWWRVVEIQNDASYPGLKDSSFLCSVAQRPALGDTVFNCGRWHGDVIGSVCVGLDCNLEGLRYAGFMSLPFPEKGADGGGESRKCLGEIGGGFTQGTYQCCYQDYQATNISCSTACKPLQIWFIYMSPIGLSSDSGWLWGF